MKDQLANIIHSGQHHLESNVKLIVTNNLSPCLLSLLIVNDEIDEKRADIGIWRYNIHITYFNVKFISSSTSTARISISHFCTSSTSN